MTSISAATSSSYTSPLQKLQEELQAEVKSGASSSSDQSALSSALTKIDSSLQSSRASDQSSGTKPSPGDLKSKIDNLIAGEVSSGKLTSNQATELQNVFKSAFANGGPAVAPAARPAPPARRISCSSSSSRCRIRCRPRQRRPTAQPVFPAPAVTAAPLSRRF